MTAKNRYEHPDKYLDLEVPDAEDFFNDDKYRSSFNLPRVEFVNHGFVDWYTYEKRVKREYLDDASDGYRGHDERLLRYLCLPSDLQNVNFDLTKCHKDDEMQLKFSTGSEKISHFAWWIRDFVSQNGPEILEDQPVICSHNVLRKIMSLPFIKNPKGYIPLPSFTILAIKLGNFIHLVRLEDDEDKKVQPSVTAYGQPSNSKQGLKFEHYMLAEGPNEEPNTDKPVESERDNFRLVCKATFGRHRLLYVCKQKGLAKASERDNLPNVSTFFMLTKPEKKLFSWSLLLSWWTKASLIQVDKIFIGRRTDTGHVKHIDVIRSSELLKKALSAYARGDKNVMKKLHYANWRTDENKYVMSDMCFGFLARFLDHVVSILPKGPGEGPHVVYKFEWHPEHEEKMVCHKLIGEAGVEACFVPAWYSEWLDTACTPISKNN